MHSVVELKRLARSETNAKKRIRILAVSHFSAGENRTEIASYLQVSRCSVNRWISNYLTLGLQGLDSIKPSGRPHRLTSKQLDNLSQHIDIKSKSAEGGRLQAADIKLYIEQTFGIVYKIANIYRLLHSTGFSWITSRSKHPKQDQAQQDAFKKNSN